MKKVVFLLLLLLLGSSVAVFGQSEQLRRLRDRMNRSIEVSKEREQGNTSGSREAPGGLPVPKAAKMNVDVQGILSRENLKGFDEAKEKAVSRVADGDNLWLYVKFNGKLGDYVRTLRDPENEGQYKYVLYAEIAPEGDITAKNQYILQFTLADLELTEFKINLAPGMPGRNASMPVFLASASEFAGGVWNNEFRLTNSSAVPRQLTQNLISVPLTFDFAGGVSRYPAMDRDYYSMVIRGTPDPVALPIPGMFYNLPLKAEITENLTKARITPVRFYFAGDNWDESTSGSFNNIKRTRKIFAAFTYKTGETCKYGVAEIKQDYQFMDAKYGPPQIELQLDLPIDCERLN